MSGYHLEAAIAYEHCVATDYEATNWKNIVRYYNMLLLQNPDPIVALNKCIAIMEQHGAAKAFQVVQQLKIERALDKYYLYHATLGEIYARLGEDEKAVSSFKRAQKLTLSNKEKRFLMDKIQVIQN